VRLGCDFDARLPTYCLERNGIPGRFVAGDASDNVQSAIDAAVEGRPRTPTSARLAPVARA
jgi:hypothetical protein